jgi:hypothetical protein
MPHLGLITPGKETQYPLSRRPGEPWDWSGQVWKILFPLGFDSRTIQPIASCYTDCAILGHREKIKGIFFMNSLVHQLIASYFI